jgi:hypothetical protein
VLLGGDAAAIDLRRKARQRDQLFVYKLRASFFRAVLSGAIPIEKPPPSGFLISERYFSMKFSNGSVNNIRSISQRGLALHWARLARVDGLPSFSKFDPGPRVHDPKQLAIWNVESDGGRTAFRALYRGSLLDEAFNEGWIGRTLDEVTPPALQPAIVAGSLECARKRCAIYMILRTLDEAGHSVDLERLLIPFGEDGQVKQIVASLQLISLKGVAERRKIVSKFGVRLDCVLSISIPATISEAETVR